MTLRIDPDQLASCVGCGLCLPHCPTFRVTGDEARSPRGRIAVMSAASTGVLEVDDDVIGALETCIQCRGCETACPSGVPFGSMIHQARVQLAAGPHRRRTRLLALVHRVIAIGWLLRSLSVIAGVLQRARLLPSRRLGLPRRIPLRRAPLTPTGDDVWLFTGCVMDAWQRPVHADAISVVSATGHGVAIPPPGGCCGALADHAGDEDTARAQAKRTMAALPGTAPILVDAAGCGAMLADYGRVIGTDEAHRFAARVVDIHTWLADHEGELPPPRPGWTAPRVAVVDPCHLRHVQRAHEPVRTVLSRCAIVVELDDDGMCCGAGGAFAVSHPDLAERVRARKLESIRRAGAGQVVVANPGCSMHLDWAGVDVEHPVSVLARSMERTAAAPGEVGDGR